MKPKKSQQVRRKRRPFKVVGKLASIVFLTAFLTLASAAFVKEPAKINRAKSVLPVRTVQIQTRVPEKIVLVKKQVHRPIAHVIAIAKPVKQNSPKVARRRIATIDFSEMELAMAGNLHKPITQEEINNAARVTRHRNINFDDNFPDE